MLRIKEAGVKAKNITQKHEYIFAVNKEGEYKGIIFVRQPFGNVNSANI